MKKYLLTLASVLALAVTAAIASDTPAPAKEKDAKEKVECAACKAKGSTCDKCAEAKKKAESEKKH